MRTRRPHRTEPMTYYLTTLLVYAGVDVIACIALNLQFGVSGLVNFGFIIFQAAGAYTAAVMSMPSQTANGGFQQYVGGFQLPFPPHTVSIVLGSSLRPGIVVVKTLG